MPSRASYAADWGKALKCVFITLFLSSTAPELCVPKICYEFGEETFELLGAEEWDFFCDTVRPLLSRPALIVKISPDIHFGSLSQQHPPPLAWLRRIYEHFYERPDLIPQPRGLDDNYSRLIFPNIFDRLGIHGLLIRDEYPMICKEILRFHTMPDGHRGRLGLVVYGHPGIGKCLVSSTAYKAARRKTLNHTSFRQDMLPVLRSRTLSLNRDAGCVVPQRELLLNFGR